MGKTDPAWPPDILPPFITREGTSFRITFADRQTGCALWGMAIAGCLVPFLVFLLPEKPRSSLPTPGLFAALLACGLIILVIVLFAWRMMTSRTLLITPEEAIDSWRGEVRTRFSWSDVAEAHIISGDQTRATIFINTDGGEVARLNTGDPGTAGETIRSLIPSRIPITRIFRQRPRRGPRWVPIAVALFGTIGGVACLVYGISAMINLQDGRIAGLSFLLLPFGLLYGFDALSWPRRTARETRTLLDVNQPSLYRALIFGPPYGTQTYREVLHLPTIESARSFGKGAFILCTVLGVVFALAGLSILLMPGVEVERQNIVMGSVVTFLGCTALGWLCRATIPNSARPPREPKPDLLLTPEGLFILDSGTPTRPDRIIHSALSTGPTSIIVVANAKRHLYHTTKMKPIIKDI